MSRGEKAVDAYSAKAAKGGKSPLPRHSSVDSAECVPVALPGFLGSAVRTTSQKLISFVSEVLVPLLLKAEEAVTSCNCRSQLTVL